MDNEKLPDDAASAKRSEWIRTSPDSPRNWAPWRKWRIIAGLNFYTFIVFIVSTGYVTDDATKQFGVGEEVSILGQSMIILGIAIGVSLSNDCQSEWALTGLANVPSSSLRNLWTTAHLHHWHRPLQPPPDTLCTLPFLCWRSHISLSCRLLCWSAHFECRRQRC